MFSPLPYLILFLSLLVASPLYSQSCLQSVRECYKKMNNPDAELKKNNLYYLNYTVLNTMRDTALLATSGGTFEVLLAPGFARLLSDQVEVYQDITDAFMIIPSRKIIYHTASALRKAQESMKKEMMIIQDTLFTLAAEESCREITLADGTCYKEVILVIRGMARQAFKIEKMTFQLSAEKQFIHKIVIQFTPEKEIAQTEVTFNALDYNYKKPVKNNTPVARHFLDGNGRLLARYTGYELVEAKREDFKP
ncbi:MAG: hypothetical protein HYY40_14415 [Bacteroidetes bacterium]|nr:hypothetical protein [Bacteroidota bacterium]